MKSTFVTTTAVGVVGLGVGTYKHSVIGGKIDPKRRNELIETSVICTATTIAANTINQNKLEQMHEKYASSYVESMSDEELASALQQIGELSGEDEVTLENVKTK